ncbi:MAG: hypothetical protein P1Q69_16940 [Candidatus Thorarchaeota archaeon]|nr:hypothetical protein [Candidatus Thorarchaeota archaeon]
MSNGSLLAFIESVEGWVQYYYIVKFSSDGAYQWHSEVEYEWFPDFGTTQAYLSAAPNGIAYVATTISNKDIGIFSYDVGETISYFPETLLLFALLGCGLVGISTILINRFRGWTK